MSVRLCLLLICFSFLRPISAATGATLVADLNSGPNGSYPSNFTAYANFLYFRAYTLDTGYELFKTDGTNVTLVSDINETKDDISGTGILEGNDSLPSWLTPFNGALFFSAFDPRRGAELWTYNGSTPQRAADINPDLNDTIKFAPNSAWPSELTVFNNALYFSADNSSFRTNYELWKYDGTNAALAANIHSDIGPDHSSYPNNLKVLNGALYFMADDGAHGFELWKSDGTNTALLSDINTGPNSSFPKKFTPFRSEIIFVATRDDIGYELFKTDGTNVTLAADINTGPLDSFPDHLTEFNGSLYFRAADPLTGAELWKYDGTNATLAADINTAADSFPKNLTVFNSHLIFAADDGIHGWELWKYNGASAEIITNLNSVGDSFPESFTTHNNILYFTATTPETGYELWKYDGTNVTLAADINSGPGDSFPQFLYAFDEKLFFRATADGIGDWELWSYTPEPTTPPPAIDVTIQAIEKFETDIRLRWTTAGLTTNIVQAAAAITGPFEDITPPLTPSGVGEVTLEYTDLNATTQPGSRFYRIKRL